MKKKINPYYIGAGVLFAVSGLAGKQYLLIICGIALICSGFTKGDKE